jgi:hypothetical protein
MAGARHVHWRRWVATIVSFLLALKTAVFLVSHLFRFAKREVESRGGDTAFVLGLTERRRAVH